MIVRTACDAMLGSLATWLRLLGCDTLFVPDIADAELLAVAQREERIIVTRDRALANHADAAILVHSTGVGEQLREVAGPLELCFEFDPTTARCSRCNGCLEPAPRGAVAPAQMAAQQCLGCGQLYWQGTHVDRIRNQLASWRPASTSNRDEELSDNG